MPPNLFYSPETYGWADTFWRWFDGPNACFPSLHASNCLLLIQLNWNRRQRTLHTIFGVGVIASTVLVKQHYVVDLLGGFAVYLAAYWCLARVRIEGGALLRYRSAAALNDS
jgi:membrane-associated phospholipid phosphatase